MIVKFREGSIIHYVKMAYTDFTIERDYLQELRKEYRDYERITKITRITKECLQENYKDCVKSAKITDGLQKIAETKITWEL